MKTSEKLLHELMLEFGIHWDGEIINSMTDVIEFRVREILKDERRRIADQVKGMRLDQITDAETIYNAILDNDSSRYVYLDNQTPNCFLCLWKQITKYKNYTGIITEETYYCAAQGNIEISACYNSDECKQLFESKPEPTEKND